MHVTIYVIIIIIEINTLFYIKLMDCDLAWTSFLQNKEEKIKVLDYFKNTTISHSLVVDYLESLRQ